MADPLAPCRAMVSIREAELALPRLSAGGEVPGPARPPVGTAVAARAWRRSAE